MVRAKAPYNVGASGLGMLGPTLISWGSEEQKQRYLPKILTAEEIWCQGYSEPGAGSDLASLRRARKSSAMSSSSTARKSGPRARNTPT